MLAVLVAAVVIADVSPRAKPVRAAAPPPQEGVRQTTSGPVLSSVAVTLECTARVSGRVENCRVLGETHPGLGFGETAIALMNGQTVARGAADVQFARTIQFVP